MRLAIAFMLVSVLPALESCSRTKQARVFQTSGFLGDYSELQGGDDTLLMYVNPEADFAKYTKVMIDPVEIWRSETSDLSDMPEAQKDSFASLLYHTVKDELAKDYEIVDDPGPGVMRLRMALTEASRSIAVLDTVTSIVPQARVLSTLHSFVVGTHVFVGKAGAEGEILDSQSNTRLMAAVDRRAGNKTFKGVISSWDDVESAFEHWAKQLRAELAEEREEG